MCSVRAWFMSLACGGEAVAFLQLARQSLDVEESATAFGQKLRVLLFRGLDLLDERPEVLLGNLVADAFVPGLVEGGDERIRVLAPVEQLTADDAIADGGDLLEGGLVPVTFGAGDLGHVLFCIQAVTTDLDLAGQRVAIATADIAVRRLVGDRHDAGPFASLAATLGRAVRANLRDAADERLVGAGFGFERGVRVDHVLGRVHERLDLGFSRQQSALHSGLPGINDKLL